MVALKSFGKWSRSWCKDKLVILLKMRLGCVAEQGYIGNPVYMDINVS
jgi:hypothetical protein